MLLQDGRQYQGVLVGELAEVAGQIGLLGLEGGCGLGGDLLWWEGWYEDKGRRGMGPHNAAQGVDGRV